ARAEFGHTPAAEAVLEHFQVEGLCVLGRIVGTVEGFQAQRSARATANAKGAADAARAVHHGLTFGAGDGIHLAASFASATTLAGGVVGHGVEIRTEEIRR